MLICVIDNAFHDVLSRLMVPNGRQPCSQAFPGPSQKQERFYILQAIKNWSRGRPGKEATPMVLWCLINCVMQRRYGIGFFIIF